MIFILQVERAPYYQYETELREGLLNICQTLGNRSVDG